MSESTVNYSRSLSFSLPADAVWDVLLRFDDTGLYGWDPEDLRVTGDRSFSGNAILMDTVFRVDASPYDLKLFSSRARAGIRVKSSPAGCTVIAACGVPRAYAAQGRQLMDDFLTRLRVLLDPPKAEPVQPQQAAEPETVLRSAAASDGAARNDDTPEIPETDRGPGKGSSALTALIAVLLLLLTAAGIYAAALSLKKDKKDSLVPVAAEELSGSGSVTFEAAVSLKPGDSMTSVAQTLGEPHSSEENREIYLSSERTDYGTPLTAVQVIYEGDTVSRITVLDLGNASVIGAVSAASLSPASSLAELEAQAGAPVSMVRSYAEGGISFTEYHFGYIDPHINFSPSWRGQLWVRTGDDGSFQSGTGYAYDGSDLLFHSVLSESLSRQYDDFSSYLDDLTGYRFCLSLCSQPDRTQTESLIPGLSQTDQIEETSLFSAFSQQTDTDGEPVWAYTAGFGIRGDFVLFSAVNRRLWERDGQLERSGFGSVRSGMSLREAEGCMGILPSMIYIDHSFLTLGYGRMKTDTDVLTEQFEFCVRFSLTDSTVESVYDNTGTQLIID